jgi:3D (Asp-Asp-Asp) domain-containing protein
MLQMGAPGLAVSRIRTRYENGQEVSSETEAEAIVRPPQDQIIGARTKIVVGTVDTPDGPIEYYRSLKVYATSYSPCRAGPGRCGHGTAGGMKVTRGVIAVRGSWWRYMNGDPVYIPGYGRAVISDIGGGIPGRYWIDLGFTDDDYESWHDWTTLYWLTPPPATIMWVLPY